MSQRPDLHYRISQNGFGWHWEVFAGEHAVIARGLAETQARARVAAMSAGARVIKTAGEAATRGTTH